MDYGALAMDDIPNPNRKSKHYTKQSKFEGSKRYVRAHIVRYLLKCKQASFFDIAESCKGNAHLEKYQDYLEEILTALADEGFIRLYKGIWRIV